jgi:hypothetical protein
MNERDPTRKSFAELHQAHAFFGAHSGEADADVQALVAVLGPKVRNNSNLRVADYGSGDGSLLGGLLSKLAIDPSKLQLSLVEPDPLYLAEAMERLEPYSTCAITGRPQWSVPRPFDLLICTHVLYYVPSLKAALADLVARVSQTGVLCAVMGRADYPCVDLWLSLFRYCGIEFPYYLSTDLEGELRRALLSYEKCHAPFVIEFPDNARNRTTFVRFLMGHHFDGLRSPAGALALLDRYQRRGSIRLEHEDTVYAIQPHHGSH